VRRRSITFALSLIAVAGATLPVTADARFFGGRLNAPANVGFGCEAAPVLDPITGVPSLFASGQRTCTFRHIGYINTNRITSIVPASGRIVRIRVRAGRNPAPLRLTILGASSSIANGFSCCTARRFGRVFRPRPNRVTTIRTNVRVRRSNPNGATQFNDVVALSAVGPGTLPMRDQGTAGTFTPGTALTALWYPLTGRGDPRVEAISADGLDLLFQWDFRRGG
jgi:hypothetical protein